ncbi:MAG: nucleotidyltransferase domain-containing protein [Oculatellaceae cyanobacterium Prado106]|jgi:predicted nucleotidyltransferase|nr:nucleotidyltransferase domain-containing protein [Oculatellaceae cyanobacterium Prado106]
MHKPLLNLNDVQVSIPRILEQISYVKLIILFGSRAREDHDETSDWDIAVLYDEAQRKEVERGGWDWLRGWSIIQQELDLSDDALDVVDLGKCSKILAHAIARDGKLLYEREPGEFDRFKHHASMNQDQLKAFRQETRSEVQAFLKEWGL